MLHRLDESDHLKHVRAQILKLDVCYAAVRPVSARLRLWF